MALIGWFGSLIRATRWPLTAAMLALLSALPAAAETAPPPAPSCHPDQCLIKLPQGINWDDIKLPFGMIWGNCDRNFAILVIIGLFLIVIIGFAAFRLIKWYFNRPVIIAIKARIKQAREVLETLKKRIPPGAWAYSAANQGTLTSTKASLQDIFKSIEDTLKKAKTLSDKIKLEDAQTSILEAERELIRTQDALAARLTTYAERLTAMMGTIPKIRKSLSADDEAAFRDSLTKIQDFFNKSRKILDDLKNKPLGEVEASWIDIWKQWDELVNNKPDLIRPLDCGRQIIIAGDVKVEKGRKIKFALSPKLDVGSETVIWTISGDSTLSELPEHEFSDNHHGIIAVQANIQRETGRGPKETEIIKFISVAPNSFEYTFPDRKLLPLIITPRIFATLFGAIIISCVVMTLYYWTDGLRYANSIRILILIVPFWLGLLKLTK